PSRGLDEIDTAIMGQVLANLADPSQLEQTGEDQVQASGQLSQQQQVGQLLGLALGGDSEALQIVEQRILPQFESEGSDFRNLAVVVRLLLKGEQDQSKLQVAFAALDQIDQAIIQLAFGVVQKGKTTEDPQEAFFNTLVAAARGDETALPIATELIEKMQENKETRELGKALERLALEGERNPAILTRKLDEAGKALIGAILERLQEAE
ncbi:MAG: hypothetical protein HXX20_24175, partial [Chloroflexi bacterium]|nr:hypothetical protein [Chloroflexota bacterium]